MQPHRIPYAMDQSLLWGTIDHRKGMVMKVIMKHKVHVWFKHLDPRIAFLGPEQDG
jgi:hypothetical protein